MNRIDPGISLNELHKRKPVGNAQNGRKVFANQNLHNTIEGLRSQQHKGNHQAYHAIAITRAVDGLRAGDMYANTFIKEGNPRRRCVLHSGFEIEYELEPGIGSQGQIHIVDIRFTEGRVKEFDRAGLWKAMPIKNSERWVPNEWQPQLRAGVTKPGSEQHPIQIGINGYCKNERHAASMLPSHIARGEKRQLDALKQTGYQLFYVPTSKNVFKAGWQALSRLGKQGGTREQREAVQILAAHMREAHESGLHVEWTSQRSGSLVLTEAMKLLSQQRSKEGKPLNVAGKQRIFLSDPTSNIMAADTARRAIGMDTRDSKWYNGSRQNVGYSLGALQLGIASMACSFNALHDNAKGAKVGASVGWGVAAAGAGTALYTNAASLVAALTTAGVAPAMAAGVANAILNNIPSLNEGYHSSKTQGLNTLATKIANKVG